MGLAAIFSFNQVITYVINRNPHFLAWQSLFFVSTGSSWWVESKKRNFQIRTPVLFWDMPKIPWNWLFLAYFLTKNRKIWKFSKILKRPSFLTFYDGSFEPLFIKIGQETKKLSFFKNRQNLLKIRIFRKISKSLFLDRI